MTLIHESGPTNQQLMEAHRRWNEALRLGGEVRSEVLTLLDQHGTPFHGYYRLEREGTKVNRVFVVDIDKEVLLPLKAKSGMADLQYLDQTELTLGKVTLLCDTTTPLTSPHASVSIVGLEECLSLRAGMPPRILSAEGVQMRDATPEDVAEYQKRVRVVQAIYDKEIKRPLDR